MFLLLSNKSEDDEEEDDRSSDDEDNDWILNKYLDLESKTSKKNVCLYPPSYPDEEHLILIVSSDGNGNDGDVGANDGPRGIVSFKI